jgi:hypothetical protein
LEDDEAACRSQGSQGSQGFLRSGTWKKKTGDHKDPVGNLLETGDITDISHLYMEKPS